MKRLLAAVLLFCLHMLPVLPDSISLRNGDRLSGQIKTLKDGKLTLVTSYAGEIKLTWTEVEQIFTQQAYRVRFSSGRAVTGTLSASEPGVLEVEAEQPVRVPLSEIVEIGAQAQPSAEPGLLENWHGSVDFGYTVARGNTEVSNLSFSVDPERRSQKDRIDLAFRALRSIQDGQTSSNLYKGTLRYDRFLSPRSFLFAQAGFEKDERGQLDLRTSQGGGFGYRIRTRSDTQLAVFGGVTFLQEKFTDLERDLEAEGVAGFELDTGWLKPLILSTKTEFLPLLTESRYRLDWVASLRLPLWAGLTLGFQVFNDFDSDPPRAGIQKNDFGLVSTFGWSF